MIRFSLLGALFLCVSELAFSSVAPFAPQVEPGDWKGDNLPRLLVDKATGTRLWEYAERNPSKTAVFYLEFADPGLANYEALEFRWELAAADADVVVSIEGYPENSLRHYYLRKRPNPPGKWQKVFLNLKQDDDGAILGLKDGPEKGRVRVKFEVSLRNLNGASNPEVIFRLADLRFVRYPIRLTGDYITVKDLHDPERIGQRYTLVLENQTGEPQKVFLKAETERLRGFEVKLPETPIKLDGGETCRFDVDIFVSREKAEELPPLSSGEAPLFAWTEQEPELKTTWFDSYFIRPIIGAIPPVAGTGSRFIRESDRQRAMRKVEKDPKAQALFKKMRKEADAWLEREILLPKLFHGYSGFYVCKEHNSPLSYIRQDSHWCVKGKHLVEGNDRVDRAGAYQQHSLLTHAALSLARFGWLTSDKRYSRKAAEILLAYAAIYPELPLAAQESAALHSRVGHVVLGECWWFAPIPFAFDLIRGADILSDSQYREIVSRLILPAISAIHDERIGANQQAEINRAVGIGALVAQNWPLAADALDGEMGMRFQLKEDFDADGMTVERDIPYHFAALIPMDEMAQAYEALGAAVFDGIFRRLYEAPISYAPDQLVGKSVYESAMAAWGSPEFARQVEAHRKKGWDWASLLSSIEQIDETSAPIGNSTLDAAGYTTLRRELPDGELVTAMVNYGSPAWRSGKSLLDPLMTWNKLPLNQRIQRIGYAYEGARFSETPAAGNSLMVDGQGSSMRRADQDALLSTPFPAGRWTSPLERPLFAGVQWSRTVAICGRTVVMLDTFAADKRHRFDLITYLPGPLTEAPLPRMADYPALLQEGEGYSYFRAPRRAIDKVEKLKYALDLKRKDVSGELAFPDSSQDIFFAEAQAGWHPKWVPALIRRFEGGSGWAITSYSGKTVAREEVLVRRLAVLQSDGRAVPAEDALAVEVITPEGRYLVLGANAPEKYIVDGTPMSGPLDGKFFKTKK